MRNRSTQTHPQSHTTKAGKNTQNSKIYTIVKIAQCDYRTSHCKNLEKSTCSTDCLNRGNEEKSTLAGSEFHTWTIRSLKMFRRFEFLHCVLYSLYGCPLMTDVVQVVHTRVPMRRYASVVLAVPFVRPPVCHKPVYSQSFLAAT